MAVIIYCPVTFSRNYYRLFEHLKDWLAFPYLFLLVNFELIECHPFPITEWINFRREMTSFRQSTRLRMQLALDELQQLLSFAVLCISEPPSSASKTCAMIPDIHQWLRGFFFEWTVDGGCLESYGLEEMLQGTPVTCASRALQLAVAGLCCAFTIWTTKSVSDDVMQNHSGSGRQQHCGKRDLMPKDTSETSLLFFPAWSLCREQKLKFSCWIAWCK